MQLIKVVAAGDLPTAFGYNALLNRVYCVNLFGYNVTVIDGAGDSVVATVPVGRYPYAPAGIRPVTWSTSPTRTATT